MPRTLALCGLGHCIDDEVCGELPAYRVEARAAEGKRVAIQLCHQHIHRAWQLAQCILDRKYPGQNFRVRSIHLHQLAKAAAKAAEPGR